MFTVIDAIPVLKNKPREIREIFATKANSKLAEGFSRDEAITAGLSAVQLFEKSVIATKKAFNAPLGQQETLKRFLKSPETAQIEAEIEKAEGSSQNTDNPLIAASFDEDAKLILKFKDGRVVVSNPVPIIAIERQVIVIGESGRQGTISSDTEGLTELTYSGEDLQRVDMPDGSYKELTWSSGRLTQVDHIQSDKTVRKTLYYTLGVLTSVFTEIL